MADIEDEKYLNTKIYNIVNLLDPTKIYVGSTIYSLQWRMNKHKYQMQVNQDKIHAIH